MKINELILAYVNRDTGKERKIGRYWASDLHYIKKGYTNTVNFLDKKEIDCQGASNILSGVAYEDMLKKIFDTMKVDYTYNPAYEIKVTDDIVISVKPDFVLNVKGVPKIAIETKCPVSETLEIPEKWHYQLECEHRVTGVPVFCGIFSHPFSIKLVPFRPLDSRFEEIKELVKDFDRKLRKKHGIKK